MPWVVYDPPETYACYKAKLFPRRRQKTKWTNRWNRKLRIDAKNARGRHSFWMGMIQHHGDALPVKDIVDIARIKYG